MATNTTNYGFKKPDESDFYDVADQNKNWDLADEALKNLDTPTFEDYTGSTAVPSATDAIDQIKSKGKLGTLLANIKAAFKGACLIGHIVNSCVSDRADLPLSAAQGKVLKDLYTQLYSEVSNPDRINLKVLIEKTSLNSPERTGVYYVTGNNIGALPSGFSNYGILLCMRSPYSLHPTNRNCVYVQEYTDVYGKHASRSFNNGAWTNWTITATKDDLNERFSSSDAGTTYNSVSDFPTTGSGFGVNTKNLTLYTGFVIPDFSRICYMNYGNSPDGALIAIAPSGEIYSAFRNSGVWQNGKVR